MTSREAQRLFFSSKPLSSFGFKLGAESPNVAWIIKGKGIPVGMKLDDVGKEQQNSNAPIKSVLDKHGRDGYESEGPIKSWNTNTAYKSSLSAHRITQYADLLPRDRLFAYVSSLFQLYEQLRLVLR